MQYLGSGQVTQQTHAVNKPTLWASPSARQFDGKSPTVILERAVAQHEKRDVTDDGQRPSLER